MRLPPQENSITLIAKISSQFLNRLPIPQSRYPCMQNLISPQLCPVSPQTPSKVSLFTLKFVQHRLQPY